MPKPIAVLPLDDRPPNYEFPRLLGQAAGYQIDLPPKDWLGTPWRPGRLDQLAAWLREQAGRAEALIVALDTLGYGGLVNSRRSTDSVETVLARLELLRELKTAHPDLTILAYSVLMRISRGNTAEEEKPYWGTYGARVFRLSVLEDRQAMLVGSAAEAEELAQLQADIPADILADYRQGRARNHAVNRAMIEWAADGIFDYLIIPQDDTVEYGWNIAEARALRLLARKLHATDRVSIYPGADETDMLLLARHAARQTGFRPKIFPRYSSVRAEQVITAYEDRPMAEMIKAHLGPLAGTIVSSPEQADIQLYVNSPAEVQGHGADQYVLMLDDADVAAMPETVRTFLTAYRGGSHLAATLREMHSVERNVPEFTRSLAGAVADGRTCAVVDVAYVNGGDIALLEELYEQVDLAQVAAFGGWNTAGNTLGTVLAHSLIRHLQKTEGTSAEALAAHVAFLFLRFVDDALYQGPIRSQVFVESLPPLETEPRMSDLGDLAPQIEAEVGRRLSRAAAGLAGERFIGRTVAAGQTELVIKHLGIRDVFLPWRRLFEVGCRIDLVY